MLFRLFCLCSLISMPALAQTPRVVSDIAPVRAIATRVMEGIGEVDLLLRPNLSPHGASLRPSQAGLLQDADLIIWVGPELTPWLDRAIDNLAPQAQNLPLLTVKGFKPLAFREVEEDADHGHHEDGHHEDGHEGHDDHDDQHEEHDHAAEHNEDDHNADAHTEHDRGHDHDGIDPHAWLDPQIAALWAGEIARALSKIDPEHAGVYEMNAQLFELEMNELSREIATLLTPVQKRGFVTYHDAYQYFETRFGLTYAGSVTPSDASAASPARLAQLREEIAEKGITCALRDVQNNDKLLRVAGENLNLHIDALDPLGQDISDGSEFYPQLLLNMAHTFHSCLTR